MLGTDIHVFNDVAPLKHDRHGLLGEDAARIHVFNDVAPLKLDSRRLLLASRLIIHG